MRFTFLHIIVALLVLNCAPITFSNMQSASIVDKGKYDITGSMSSSIGSYNYGFQLAYGIGERSNIRMRLDRIKINPNSSSNSEDFLNPSNININESFTHLSFGVKRQLINNRLAAYIPISFTKNDKYSDVFTLFEPTIIYSLRYKKYFEINPINRTLPHVKKIVEWNPITKSVNAKDSIIAGMYLVPNIAGT